MSSFVALTRARRARRFAVAAVLVLAGCNFTSPGPTTRYEVTSTAPAGQTVEPGQQGTFEVTVKNVGPDEGDFFLGADADVQSDLELTRCTRGTAATCPTDWKVDPEVTGLRPGASLTFEVRYTIHADATGHIENRVRFGGNDDTGHAGSLDVVSHATVHDTVGGDYQLYASDGQVHAANVDFVAGRLMLSGGAGNLSYAFQREFSFPTYFIAGISEFSTVTDLLVGTLDVGLGVQPFIAARKFVATAAELEGRRFVVFSRSAPSDGAPSSGAYEARVEEGMLVACKSSPPSPLDACPAEALFRYALGVTADGTTFTGLDAAHGDGIAFRVARSGDAMVFLSAESGPAGTRFEAGVEADAELSEVTSYRGGDSLGRAGNLTVEPDRYWAHWNRAEETQAAITPAAGYPAGVFIVDGALQLSAHGPLALLAGVARGSADGQFQVWARQP